MDVIKYNQIVIFNKFTSIHNMCTEIKNNNHLYTLNTDLSSVPNVFGINKFVVSNFEKKT